jgi:hypothetical protein
MLALPVSAYSHRQCGYSYFSTLGMPANPVSQRPERRESVTYVSGPEKG